MAARTVQSAASNANDAAFRAWAQAIHDALAFVGLVQTADTGQINLATVAVAGANTAAGYEMWRFADALQATAPVFVKFEYGSGGASSIPAVWMTVGTGTDGAGNLTGKVSFRVMTTANLANDATARDFYQSGDTNRFAFNIFRHVGSQYEGNIVFSVERTHDVDGSDTGEGVLIVVSDGDVIAANNRGFMHQALLVGVASAQVRNYGPVPAVNAGDTTALDSGNVGWFPWALPSRRGTQNPCRNVIGHWTSDAVGSTQVNAVPLYGINHTFMTLNGPGGNPTAGVSRGGVSGASSSAGVTVQAGFAMAIRYD